MSSEILELLRQHETLTVADMMAQLQVTATAVRQQLQRLLAEDLVQRSPTRGERGRPRHAYALTEKGRQTSGTNYADLALALWFELRSIPEARRGLVQRLAARMTESYAGQIRGVTAESRMESVRDLFAQRDIPLRVRREGDLPVLDALACPYPDLAAQDRSICSLERLMFAELLGSPLTLSQCRLDGDHCCSFATKPIEITVPTPIE